MTKWGFRFSNISRSGYSSCTSVSQACSGAKYRSSNKQSEKEEGVFKNRTEATNLNLQYMLSNPNIESSLLFSQPRCSGKREKYLEVVVRVEMNGNGLRERKKNHFIYLSGLDGWMDT